MPALAGLALLVAIGVFYLAVRDRGDGTAEQDQVAAGDGSATESGELGESGGDGAGDSDVQTEGDGTAVDAATDGGGDVAGPIAAPAPPYVMAAFNQRDLALSGTVPSEELAAQLAQASELIYSPFVTSEVQVDTSLPSPEWLAAVPQAVMLLQRIHEGTMVIADGTVTVTGTSANESDVEALRSLVQSTGLQVDLDGVEVTNLRAPLLVIVADDGGVVLNGILPTEDIRSSLVGAATAAYGGNVVDATTVDESVESELWMYTPEPLFQVLAAFPVYDVRLDGNGFSASLSGGVSFAPDSAVIAPELEPLLLYGLVVMSRDPSISLTVSGHTDSDGPEEYNQTLSQARAQAVVDFFATRGVDPARLTAVGRGETDPVADNTTPEGRALNRRVEFDFDSSTP